MLPIKKLHTETSTSSQKKDLYADLEDFDDGADVSPLESSNESHSPHHKQRKRRTLSETSKRDFICGCGKSYVSYPAIYLHVQRKHNGDWPPNTLIPEKSDNQDKVKRGRPKKEKHNMLDVNNDIQNELKYKAEDNFWLFIGSKGNTGNPKLENRFITNLETQPYNPIVIFQHSDLFEDQEIHQDISEILKCISASNNVHKQSELKAKEDSNVYETHLSHFILWIANPLKEEIFVELGIVVSLLRIVTLSCIWYEQHKSLIDIKDENLDYNSGAEDLVSIKISKADKLKLDSFAKNGICPLLGCKWTEAKNSSFSHVLLRIINETKQIPQLEKLFYEKLKVFSSGEGPLLECVIEAILNLKETELKESTKNKKKFYFLNANTREDLKELIQRTSEWIQCFDERELQLQDTGLIN